MLTETLDSRVDRPIAAGDRAPDFKLADQDGREHTLTDLLAGQKSIVLFFYPKDETYGCTREACTFRDQYDVFAEAGARVVGVSSDSVESHARFVGKHQLNFTLLSDPEGALRRRFGVPRAFLGLADGRTTYVIGADGVVRGVFNSAIQFERHVQEALALAKRG
jgi:peroxiredoxin Q/BCP